MLLHVTKPRRRLASTTRHSSRLWFPSLSLHIVSRTNTIRRLFGSSANARYFNHLRQSVHSRNGAVSTSFFRRTGCKTIANFQAIGSSFTFFRSFSKRTSQQTPLVGHRSRLWLCLFLSLTTHQLRNPRCHNNQRCTRAVQAVEVNDLVGCSRTQARRRKLQPGGGRHAEQTTQNVEQTTPLRRVADDVARFSPAAAIHSRVRAAKNSRSAPLGSVHAGQTFT